MDPFIPLPRVPIYTNRQDVVLAHARGKNVLHVGCVDTGLMEERFKRGELMHQRLMEVCSNLWGADINADGIAFLEANGIPNLVVSDAANIGTVPALQEEQFDLILATELVEHLSNPGLFFDSVQKLMVPGVTELLVTVPNAFRIRTLRMLLKGIEYVHPDHNYWFSYHTITNLMRKHGYIIRSVAAYSFLLPNSEFRWTPLNFLRRGWKHLMVKALFRTTAFWCDGLIVIAALPDSRSTSSHVT